MLSQQVLEAVTAAGAVGMTDDELEVALNGRHQSVSPRRRELVIAGYLTESASAERRMTRSGAMAKVWVATRPEQREAA